jgi:hypothetical protein
LKILNYFHFERFTLLLFSAFIFLLYSSSSGQSLYQQILNLVDSVSTENLSNHIQWLEEPGGHNSRVNFTPGNDSASVYIKKEFDKIYGLTSVVLDTFYIPSAITPFNTKPLVNVVAVLEGSGNPNSYFVLGAHLDCSASRMGTSIWNSQWDTITAPGADDNATGVAAILEIARILADPGNNFQHEYGIKFIAFGAEESGPGYSGSHHGSRHYAQSAGQNNHDVKGMVSIDMIGYNNNYDYQAIVSNNASSAFAQKFLDANDIFSIDLIMNNPPFPEATYSDHETFWAEGYNAILLIENAPPWNSNSYYTANPYYHKSSDTYETLNMELVAKVTKLNLATIAAFSGPLTDVSESDNSVIDNYFLAQNYPNPFNPTTKIKFTVPASVVGEAKFASSTNIALKIYDILGNEIAALLNEQSDLFGPGTHELEFDGTGLPSGVYIYQLSAGSYLQNRKMILLK